MVAREERRALAVRLASGLVLGYLAVAVFQVVAAAVTIPFPAAGVPLRVAHLATAFAETAGVGAIVIAGPLFAWLWFLDAPLPLAFLAMSALGSLLLYVTADVEIYRQGCMVFEDPRLEQVFFVVTLIGYGAIFPTALLLGLFLSELRRPLLGRILVGALLVLALALAVGNHILTRDDYVSIHGIVTGGLGLVVGAALSIPAAKLFRRLRASVAGRRVLVVLAAVCVAGVLVPPPDRLRCELFRDTTTFAPWILAVVWRAPQPAGDATAPQSPWLAARGDQPDTPPTQPPLVAKNPVVVLVTIDATRGDAVNDPENDADFPTLTALKAAGTNFTNATSPGSQTAVSLSALFSGKTYTMLRWKYFGVGIMRFGYPAGDPTVRFPELLNQHGVRTVAISSVNFQAEEYGVVRGFTEHRVMSHGRGHAAARQITDPAMDVLRKAGDGPLFLYFHLMEPHAPYDRGKRTGSEYERYLSEIGVADRELSRVVRLVDQKFGDRAVIIVAADHGEAFGEHETKEHSKTIYQEMIHVPLVFRTPDRTARVVDERVGLTDLGPTILDIFGVPTPSRFFGQSLVPLLEGKEVALERPVIAEGRLRRAIIERDGLKVIDDPRRKTVEAYDLVADPKELTNVFGLDPRADRALVGLRTLFRNNELAAKDPSYSPPYKP
jgi:arylsulfatase A-like enzyme